MCRNIDETTFKCSKCGECCKNLLLYSIVVFPSDILRICNNMCISKNEFLTSRCDFKDMIFGNKSIRVYFLKPDDNNECIFLKNNFCSIYQIRPVQCAKTPYGFFSYSSLWEHLPCVKADEYPEGFSYSDDMKFVKELIHGY